MSAELFWFACFCVSASLNAWYIVRDLNIYLDFRNRMLKGNPCDKCGVPLDDLKFFDAINHMAACSSNKKDKNKGEQ